MQQYTEELYEKDLHDPDNHDGVISHLEPDILECKVKNLMLLNHFSFKIVYAAIKQSPEGIWEENYRNQRTSRSQRAVPSEGGMQGRAVRQET